MTERYMVRGSPVNIVATIEHLGFRFRLSRPVEMDGQRRRQGWMLSHDGHAMALLKDCEQAAAVAKFKKLLSAAPDRDALAEAIATTVGAAEEFRYR